MLRAKTEVGKGTLINAVFQGNFVSTGQGRPTTRNTRMIKRKGSRFIFLTREVSKSTAFWNRWKNSKISSVVFAHSEDPNEPMHCAWLCISEDGRRIEDAEIKLLDLLAKHIPVVAVITKSRADNGFRSEVQRLLGKGQQCHSSPGNPGIAG